MFSSQNNKHNEHAGNERNSPLCALRAFVFQKTPRSRAEELETQSHREHGDIYTQRAPNQILKRKNRRLTYQKPQLPSVLSVPLCFKKTPRSRAEELETQSHKEHGEKPALKEHPIRFSYARIVG